MVKITIIGVGNLGSCIGYEVANRGLADELVLIDIYKDLAEGNAEDIEQSLAFRNNTKVYAGDYCDAEGSDIIIVTAGKPRSPEMKSRMDLLNINNKIIREVALNLKALKDDSILITLTNPVDVMNYLMWKYTGFDRRKVLGSAGQLDSARFRVVLSRRFNVPVLDVNAFVIGEHGENQVPVFSMVKIKGEKVTFKVDEKRIITAKLRESALKVISKKGATIYAPANNTANIIQNIIQDGEDICICSTILDGEYGLKDISIGVPVRIGREGVKEIIEWRLDDEERRLFNRGAERLHKTIREILKI